MEDIILHILKTYGLTGMILGCAAYIIYDAYKKSKKYEEWYEENVINKIKEINNDSGIKEELSNINNNISELKKDTYNFRNDVMDRVQNLESTLMSIHPINIDDEEEHINAIMKVSSTINKILISTLTECNLDHVALALLHNGYKSISGIPFVKFDVIVEKYNPVTNPSDISLCSKYKNEDITKYSHLTEAVTQSKDYIIFDINSDSPIVNLSSLVYNRCVSIGVKQLIFIPIKDQSGVCNGFIVGYSLSDDNDREPIDVNAMLDNINTIESLYKNMTSK